MKKCKSCLMDKPFSEFYPNYKRKGFKTDCKSCFIKKGVERVKNSDIVKLAVKKAALKWRQKNRQKCKELSKQWRLANPDKVKQINKIGGKAWRLANPTKDKAKKAFYNKRVKLATPNWLTKEQKQEIAHMYGSCPKGFHVDHIIPLKGSNVSGLHVPWNLQHLPAEKNLSKGNKI